MTLTVALDLDGVTYPFPLAFSTWASNQEGLPPFPEEPDVIKFHRPLGLDDADFDVLLARFAADGGYRLAAPYPEAVLGLNVMFDAGADLLAVTRRPPTRDVESATYGWIADWLLPFRSVVHGPLAKLEADCDIVVDDNPADLAAVLELGDAAAILLDRPWNQDVDGMFRCSWEELPSLVDVLGSSVDSADLADRSVVLAEALEDFS